MSKILKLFCIFIATNVSVLYAQEESPYAISEHMPGFSMKKNQDKTLEIEVLLRGSTHANRLAKDFLSSEDNSALVCWGNDSDGTINRNIEPRHFNIGVTGENQKFKSKITLQPKQKIFGVSFEYRQIFLERNEHEGFWIDIYSPFLSIENNLNLEEEIFESANLSTAPGIGGVPQVTSMEEAFRQKNWKYGKIDGARKITGLADINLKVGYHKCDEKLDNNFDAYVGILIPTSHSLKVNYAFDPVLGNGGYFGLLFGGLMDTQLWENEDNKIIARLEFDGQYLLTRKVRRTFDLYNKPLSRYMAVYPNREAAVNASYGAANDPQFTVPGANVFNALFDSSPRLSAIFSPSLEISKEKNDWELKYELGTIMEEKLDLNDYWEPGPALVAIEKFQGYTNLAANLTQNYNNVSIPVDKYTPITKDDIDISSAQNISSITRSSTITHGFIVTFKHHWDKKKYPMYTDLNFSYHFSSNTDYINHWTLWYSAGITF